MNIRYWISICESRDDDLFAYHVTPITNLSTIRTEGLIPQTPGTLGWPEYDSDSDDEDDDISEAFEPRTFFLGKFRSSRRVC